MTKKYEVRCCCTPETCYGTLELPEVKHPTTLAVQDKDGKSQSIEIRLLGSELIGQLAVYSDDRPEEFWKTMPGFTAGERSVNPYGFFADLFGDEPARTVLNQSVPPAREQSTDRLKSRSIFQRGGITVVLLD